MKVKAAESLRFRYHHCFLACDLVAEAAFLPFETPKPLLISTRSFVKTSIKKHWTFPGKSPPLFPPTGVLCFLCRTFVHCGWITIHSSAPEALIGILSTAPPLVAWLLQKCRQVEQTKANHIVIFNWTLLPSSLLLHSACTASSFGSLTWLCQNFFLWAACEHVKCRKRLHSKPYLNKIM